MAKFDVGYINHAGFNAIKDSMTAKLAAIIESQLRAMGEDAKGISWFSSVAEEYACARHRQAA